MTSDDERREVARRLREIRPCKSGHIEWWTIAKALDLKESAGWFGWEKFEPDSVNRLADLIEPDEQKVKYIAEIKIDVERLEQLVNDAVVEVTGIDRERLLALADEMRESTRGMLSDDHVDASDVWYYEHLLRKAVGA